MTRKCLIALAVLSLFAGSVAQADPAWGVTTAMVYEWAKKTTGCDVYMKVVRWAQIYGCNKPILLIQQAEGEYAGEFLGCKWLRVCNNFLNLRVDAEVKKADTSIIIKKWWISLVWVAGEKAPLSSTNAPQAPLPKWNQTQSGLWGPLDSASPKATATSDGATTTELVEDVHLTGQLGWMHLCVRANCNDPQSAQFFPNDPMANVHKVATVVLTYYPNDPPGSADMAQGAVAGNGEHFPTDWINTPDVDWPGALPPGAYH